MFTEIQQWEKESLVPYIYKFKTEAKKCNFTNDATTIRIFVKGLKNAHSLANHIYKKGPQMLTDPISEMEKFNATQQLTAMVIPPSTVNMMSHEEDCSALPWSWLLSVEGLSSLLNIKWCFQCQAQGHIA